LGRAAGLETHTSNPWAAGHAEALLHGTRRRYAGSECSHRGNAEEHDPLASHIFISRRHYRNAHDTKGGKRREVAARLSYNEACALGFRGSFDEWERLMGAVARR